MMLSVLSCSDRNSAEVRLQAPDISDSTEVLVSRLAVNRMETLDTLYFKGGKVEYKAEVRPGAPEFIYMTFSGAGNVAFLLNAGDRVSAEWVSPEEVRINGSEESVLMQQVNRDIMKFNRSFDSLSNALTAASESNDGKRVSALKTELGRLYVLRKQSALRYVMTHSGSMTAIPVLYQVAPNGQPLFSENTDAFIMEQIYDSLHVRYPSSPYLAALADDAQARRSVMKAEAFLSDAEEADFPEINLNDVNGQPRSLTALKGKVVLLLFWDATNVEQRLFNVSLKNLYAEYSKSGLEIYQVGLNTDKAAWAMQVREQALPWISVCETMWQSPASAAGLYNITEVPAMYVISRDGDITAKNLFDMDLLELEVRRLL